MRKRQRVIIVLFILTFFIITSLVYYRVTAGELNLATGILFLLAVSAFIFMVTEVSAIILRPALKIRNSLRLLCLTCSLLLIGLELFLRFGLNTYSTYHERNGGSNYHSWRRNYSSWFRVHQKSRDIKYKKKEFTFYRKVNSLGLSEQEVSVEKAPNEFRIIALGDSFTEGVGASYESAWPKVVERNLTELIRNQKITTINAGISGSDVQCNFVLFREKLQVFEPDLVIIAINHSDIDDVLMRGGMERFKPDGKRVIDRKPPSWEWAYGISYLFRHIIHDVFRYNWAFIKKKELENEQRKAVEKIKSTIDEMKILSQKAGFDLLIVIHPLEAEVRVETYISGLNHLISALRQDRGIYWIDLLEYFRVNNIISKENSSDFYWPIDLHHNKKGYEAMGNAITKKIIEFRLIESKDTEG